jgi:hypothetical protein
MTTSRGDGRAWRADEDPAALSHRVSAAHDRFLDTGRTDADVRNLVSASWRRSMRSGLDPERDLAPVDLVDHDLAAWREQHPLASVMPMIRRLLVEDAVDTGLLVAVTDAAGRLLWVEGPRPLRRRAEGIHFLPGAVWSEARAGTNAPGTSLALDQPVQIFAAEHLVRSVTSWSCSAAPIHDPDTGAILGALDLTGGDDVAAPRTLSVVRATVAAVEGELRLRRVLDGHATATSYDAGPVLRILGRPTASLEGAHGTTRLSLRHSELLALLVAHPEGMTGDQLGVALHDEDLAPVTLRAEVSRLRNVLGHLELEARPYRLGSRLRTDADEVRDRIAAGQVGAAVDLYRGPLLPVSDAPGVARLRSALHEEVRAAVIRSGDPDALLRFGDTDHGRFDWQVWQAAAAALEHGSPRSPSVLAHLAYLEAELA